MVNFTIKSPELFLSHSFHWFKSNVVTRENSGVFIVFSIIKHLLTGCVGSNFLIVPSVLTIVLGVASDNSPSGTIKLLLPSNPVNKCMLFPLNISSSHDNSFWFVSNQVFVILFLFAPIVNKWRNNRKILLSREKWVWNGEKSYFILHH